MALVKPRARWWTLLLVAFAFSAFIETMQSLGLPPGRSAALADIVSNSLGGLLGVLLVRAWGYTTPRPRTASALCLLWTVGASGMLVLTSVALGPRSHAASEARANPDANADSRATYRRSPYEYAPGYGWFTGMPDSANVNGASFAHRGSGPLVVETSIEPRTLDMSVTVRGRQAGTTLKPMLFVHTAQDTIAVGSIAVRGDDAVLSVTRRAWNWGLSLPSIRVPGAFHGRSIDDARPLTLVAHTATDRLALQVSSNAFTGSRELLLPPTFGWTMIQTFIRFDSPVSFLAQVGWLAALVFPMGWWGAQAGGPSGAQRRAVSVIAVTLFTAVAEATPSIFGVARVGAAEWLTVAVLFAIAMWAGAGARRRTGVGAPPDPEARDHA
jgi:hypothetical protein